MSEKQWGGGGVRDRNREGGTCTVHCRGEGRYELFVIKV